MKNNFNNPIYNKINKNRKKFTTDTDNQINNVSDYDYLLIHILSFKNLPRKFFKKRI